MPELPEVECLTRAVRSQFEGAKITDIIFLREDLRRPIPIPEFKTFFGDQTLARVFRRSKYMIWETESGRAYFHLGMTGNMLVHETATPQRPHTHAVFKFMSANKESRYLHFVDPRRFGLIDVSSQDVTLEEHILIKNLGVEPLACNYLGEHLYRRSRKRVQTIKAFIMDAANIVGVGNIYASESLHRAGIHPRKAAGKVPLRAYERLAVEVKDTLEEAIRAGGTSFRDYCHPGEDDLGFELQLKVYDRAGELCMRCKTTPIKQSTIAGRTSYYCPTCQR